MGSCRFYKTTGTTLLYKHSTIQFAPGNPSEILVTSADSQIRVSNSITVLQKFKDKRSNGGKPMPRLPFHCTKNAMHKLHNPKGNPCCFLPGFKNTSSHQPDLRVLHRRWPLRRVRQRGLQPSTCDAGSPTAAAAPAPVAQGAASASGTCPWPWRAPAAPAVPPRVVRAVARRRGGRQRVGDAGGDGEPRRGDQGVPELRAALRQSLPLATRPASRLNSH
ncbi:uncharacterized protein C2845_PM17G03930 [Panicum miliaceum]|uniref:Uncharacterized protein n=1 Tax=Panicum miliaceum TaxID=4540 RepID=A0A3L6Q2Q7_PANMI|nr:uncharacterized protein C2845_PM17G03930 [Panicum miliaceum]